MENSIQKNKCVSLDTLKRYKQGKLGGTKKSEIDAHLSTCQLCEYTASNFATINDKELEEDLSILKKNITNKLFNSKKQKRQSPSVLYRVAAALVFLVAIGSAIRFFTNTASPDNLYNQYYQAYEVPDALIRGTKDNSATVSAPLAKAISTYTNTPYKQSNRPSSFEQDPYQSALANLLNGLSAMKKGDAKTAIPLLEKAEKSKTKFSEDATWYLALAHLKLDDSSKSVNYLDKILLLGDGFYLEKAKALKAQLLE